jgi:hypothetical protein
LLQDLYHASGSEEGITMISPRFWKAHSPLILATIVFFVTSLLTSYIILTLTIQRTYSIPKYEGNYNPSTQGGDALGDSPEAWGFGNVGVFVGPRPGATNVSLDTVIYAYQSRTVSVILHFSPAIPIQRIKEEYEPLASRNTIFCPAELLQPDTTYNVSGFIMGESAWWTFTTGPSVTPQSDHDFLFYSYELGGFSILYASIATSIFVGIIRCSHWKQAVPKEEMNNG